MKKIDKKIYLTLLIIAVVALTSILFLSLGNESFGTGANDIDNDKVILSTVNAIDVVEISSYSGPYMEDASDREVTDVLMICVKNSGDKAIQYAEITLSESSTEKAVFKFSTLNPGEKVYVLESNMKKFDKTVNYTSAVSSNVVLFENELNTYEDRLKVQPLNGGLNITNISDEDISGEIIIYFKDFRDGTLLGGITYRGRIEGGLKKGEIRQIMSDNFTKDNTKVMFITIDGK